MWQFPLSFAVGRGISEGKRGYIGRSVVNLCRQKVKLGVANVEPELRR